MHFPCDCVLLADHLAGEIHEKEAGQFEWFGVSDVTLCVAMVGLDATSVFMAGTS